MVDLFFDVLLEVLGVVEGLVVQKPGDTYSKFDIFLVIVMIDLTD